MGSSSSALNYPLMRMIYRLSPRSILDVGCGTGKWGFIIREKTDLRVNRAKKDFIVIIDGIEIDKRWISPVHDYVYNNIIIGDIREIELKRDYDIIFMGDIVEHLDKKEGYHLINNMLKRCYYLVVTSPYGDFLNDNLKPAKEKLIDEYIHENHLSYWYPDDFEIFDIGEMEIINPSFYVLLKGKLK